MSGYGGLKVVRSWVAHWDASEALTTSALGVDSAAVVVGVVVGSMLFVVDCCYFVDGFATVFADPKGPSKKCLLGLGTYDDLEQTESIVQSYEAVGVT